MQLTGKPNYAHVNYTSIRYQNKYNTISTFRT